MSTSAADSLTAASPVDENGTEPAPKKASAQILQHEIDEGLHALERPLLPLFVSGLSAGLDIGFSPFLMAIMLTRAAGEMPKPVVDILVANMYAVGFIFVVLGRSELFTEQTTLAVLPVLRGRASLGGLLRLWVAVYISNLIGAAAFACFIAFTAPRLGVAAPEAFGTIASKVVEHPALSIFLSAVLAGWLMGLLSWLVSAVRDTISQIAVVWLIAASIGFANLHHSIVGSVEVLAGIFGAHGVTWADFGHFLLWTTLGNIVGGVVFVAIIKYGHARPDAGAAA